METIIVKIHKQKDYTLNISNNNDHNDDSNDDDVDYHMIGIIRGMPTAHDISKNYNKIDHIRREKKKIIWYPW